MRGTGWAWLAVALVALGACAVSFNDFPAGLEGGSGGTGSGGSPSSTIATTSSSSTSTTSSSTSTTSSSTSTTSTSTTSSSTTSTSSSSSSSASTSSSSSSSGTVPCANVGPVTLATVGSSTGSPTGIATQRHVFWSPNTKLWWFFYIDGSFPSNLQVASSSDFTTWTNTGAPLGMPSPSTSHGSSFSVDLYSPSGGTDVAEIAIGLEETSTSTELRHFRARLVSAISADFDQPYASIYSESTGPMVYTDHVSIAASSNGYLAIASGLSPSGADAWTVLLTTTSETDMGSWVPTWGVADDISTTNTNSRQVVSLGGGTFMTLSDDSSGTPQTVNYAMSSTSWMPMAIPFAALDQDTNGWSAAVSGSNVYVVRHTTNGYDYAAYSGGNWSVTANTPGTATSPVASSGVVTAVDGTTVVAVVIDDSTGDIWAASSNKSWKWENQMFGGDAGDAADLQGLSGYSVAVNHQVAITWTDSSGTNPVLKGALICVP